MLQQHLAHMRHERDYADQAMNHPCDIKCRGQALMARSDQRPWERTSWRFGYHERRKIPLMLNPEDDNDNDQSGKTNEWSPHKQTIKNFEKNSFLSANSYQMQTRELESTATRKKNLHKLSTQRECMTAIYMNITIWSNGRKNVGKLKRIYWNISFHDNTSPRYAQIRSVQKISPPALVSLQHKLKSIGLHLRRIRRPCADATLIRARQRGYDREKIMPSWKWTQLIEEFMSTINFYKEKVFGIIYAWSKLLHIRSYSMQIAK